MDRNLQTILLHDNPWIEDSAQLQGWLRARLPGPFLPRPAISKARQRWGENDRAHLVIGPRQSGKSTVLWAWLAERGEPALFVDRREERFARHAVVGGYPAVWLSETPEVLLADLLEAVVLRDASDLFRITRPDAFRQLLRLIAGRVGQLVNLSEWASVLGIGRDTVASYLEILEASHITLTLTPFAGGKRIELTSRPKVFLLDNGLRNRLIHDFRPLDEREDAAGPLLESWVATELWKILPDGATLHFWQSASRAEVDFVIVRGDRIVAVEVKAGRLGRPLLSKSVHSFLAAYQPATTLIVNTGLSHRQPAGTAAAGEVEWLLPIHLAARIAELFPAEEDTWT
jgi:predicted AAA+ superfamily ATPase